MEKQRNSGIILCQEALEEIRFLDARSHLESRKFFYSEAKIIRLYKGYYPQSFRVLFYSGYLKGYFTIIIHKISNYEPIDKYAFDELTWTFSIVDTSGTERFFQSISKRNFINSPYLLKIEDFIKVSVLLEQAEELLPEDVMTLRCEVFSLSFPGKYLNAPNAGLHHWDPINVKYEPLYRVEAFESHTIFQTEIYLIRDICNFIINLKALRDNKIGAKSIDLLKQKLLK